MKWMAILMICATLPVLAGEPGKGLFATCAACHGVKGEGNPDLNAPALAGQEIWYTTAQLASFNKGYRGVHEKDVYGQQMKVMAAITATEKSAMDVATYIHGLKPKKRTATLQGGDAKRGRAHFATCTACHGPQGKGLEAMKAPNLTLQQDWYIKRQLEHYQQGIRGTHEKDTYGQQMVPMSMLVANEQSMKDLIAYILTLPQ